MDPKTSELVSNLKKLNLLNSEQEMITEEILEQFEDIIDWNAVQLNSLENVNMDKLTTWLLINAFILKQCCNPHNINIQEKLITAIKTFEQKDTQLVTELLDMDMAFLIFKREWKPPMALITQDQTWGNGKIKYQKILRSPITKEMAETLCMMDDIGANIVIPTWYYLMKKGQKRNLNEEIINELHTKITKPGKVYMTTNTNNGERKINIFIRDPEDYDDLKRNKFTIELSSMTLVFSSQAKYNECNNCGKVYSGFHPCSS